MTPSISLSFWLETLVLAALAVLLVFGLVGALATRLHSARRQRLLWLVGFATLGLFLLGIGAGADRWMPSRETAMDRSERVFVVRGNLPAGETTLPKAQSTAETLAHAAPVSDVEATAPTPVRWPGWIWLAGTLLVLGYGTLQRLVLGFMVRRATDACPDLRARVVSLATRMGLRVPARVRVLAGLAGPATFGAWRPTILVPHGFAQAHSPARQDAMLTHELAHVAARDPFWLGAARLLVALHWWHPAAWWALGRLRAATEAAADEASVLIDNGPTELAACLVALGGRLHGRGIGWLGMAGSGFRSELGRRVEHLLDLSSDPASWRKPRRTMAWIAIVPLLSSMAMVGATAWARPYMGETEPAFMVLAQHALGDRQPTSDAGGQPGAASTPRTREQGEDLSGRGFDLARLESGPETDPSDAPAATQDASATEGDAPTGVLADDDSEPAEMIIAPGASIAVAAASELATRSFKLNPGQLGDLFGESDTAQPGNITATSLGKLFEAAGVDWGEAHVLTAAEQDAAFHTDKGKTLLFNPGNGMMLVRATPDDLALIESTLAVLNTPAPKVRIEAKFVEITSSDATELGFDWFLGNTLVGGAHLASPANSDPQPLAPAPTQGVWPGQAPATPDEPSPEAALPSGAIPPDPAGAEGSSPRTAATMTLTGILTDPQFRAVINALERRPGVDILAGPHVTTLSGRRAQISWVQLKTVVNGLVLEAEGDPGSEPDDRTHAARFRTEQIPVGPVLDVFPRVDADQGSIDLTVTATVTEFLGYESAPDEAPVIRVQVNDGKPMLVQAPTPRLRVRTASTSVRMRDGETVVLGGMTTREQVRTKDKVPVLGDIPLVGRAFRGESQMEVRKQLLVFVTATIVD